MLVRTHTLNRNLIFVKTYHLKLTVQFFFRLPNIKIFFQDRNLFASKT